MPGSLLVLYTDGLIEAKRDVLAGMERLHAAVAGLPRGAVAPATAIYDRVLLEPAHDDVAILTVEVQRSPFECLATSSGDGVSRWTFEAANAGEAQRARTEFVAQLRAAGAADEDLLAAEIVFGELVGNVVRHAAGSVDAMVDWHGLSPVLHVRDTGRGFAFVPRLPRDVFAESGRGLYIIAVLTDDFNVTRGDDGGSHREPLLRRRVIGCRFAPPRKRNRMVRISPAFLAKCRPAQAVKRTSGTLLESLVELRGFGRCVDDGVLRDAASEFRYERKKRTNFQVASGPSGSV